MDTDDPEQPILVHTYFDTLNIDNGEFQNLKISLYKKTPEEDAETLERRIEWVREKTIFNREIALTKGVESFAKEVQQNDLSYHSGLTAQNQMVCLFN